MFLQENRGSIYVRHRFQLPQGLAADIRSRTPRFGFGGPGGFGEAVYYRTYSRRFLGRQESWADTVLRVVRGAFSVRMDWYDRRGLVWDAGAMSELAHRMADAMFEMRFLPPGRGLYAMGTDHVYRVGSMPLFNCGATTTRSANLADELAWVMDALMCGVGVGAEVTSEPIELRAPGFPADLCVPDSREGWVDSVRALIEAFTLGAPRPRFDYSGIRKAGTPLMGIGGVASGPEPLQRLHAWMEATLERALRGEITPLRLRADLVNQIGACVSMADVRRSSEMLIGPANSPEFHDLKNYEANPDRADWGWASNNSFAVDSPDDAARAASAIAYCAGEKPGVLNRMRLRAGGDRATLVNPCGEIPLESRELCNVVEVLPTRCKSEAEFTEALDLATFYASSVSLLPTHHPSTNAVIHRNRRIGVSLTGVSSVFDLYRPGLAWNAMLAGLRRYVRGRADHYAQEARVLAPVRVTTVKPSGTVSQLAGVTPGMHWAVDTFAVRRMRVGEHSPIRRVLDAAGMPSERDPNGNLLVYSWPIFTPGRAEKDVPMCDQVALLTSLAEHYADNAVSCTLKASGDDADPRAIHAMLDDVIPRVTTVSLMRISDLEEKYALAPYERISEHEYRARAASVPKVDWSKWGGDGQDAGYCDGGSCQL